jgi:serine/threonine-protein kinase
VVLVGFGLSVLLSLGVLGTERQRERLAFEMRAGHVAQAVRGAFELPLEALEALPALYASSQSVSRAEFQMFVAGSLRRHPAIYAFEWLPLVPAAERDAYEKLARAEGIVDFEFKDDLGAGLSRRAAARPEHLPIYFMEPPNPTPLGFDVASEPARRAPADRARDEGRAIASDRIRLVEDAPDIYSIAVFLPVYAGGRVPATLQERRAQVRGYAVEVFRIGPVVDYALRGMDAAGLQLALVDDDGPAGMQVLYESGAEAASPPAGMLRLTRPFPYAGRSWTLTASTRPRASLLSGRSLTVFGAGLAISVLLAVVLGALRTILRLRKQVDAALQLGQYTLQEKLGEGGMGVVYMARHAMLRRPTAIKLLPKEFAAGTRIARFEREARLTSQLAHPNTIAVYDYGCTPEGVFYYAMEYIDGITLQELVRLDGAQPTSRAVHLLKQVCGSLSEAHAIGLIHRDIKPANIMLSTRAGITDFVKVLDFGLAREIERGNSPELSVVGAPIGTPLYLSPEAIKDPESVDARSDIYALGAVAYYLVTGQHVFEGHSTVEVCTRHMYAEPDPPSTRTSNPIPQCFEAVILRCLAKEPGQRPASAAELLRALEACAGVEAWSGGVPWWRERGASVCAEASAARRRQELAVKQALITTVAVRPGD